MFSTRSVLGILVGLCFSVTVTANVCEDIAANAKKSGTPPVLDENLYNCAMWALKKDQLAVEARKNKCKDDKGNDNLVHDVIYEQAMKMYPLFMLGDRRYQTCLARYCDNMAPPAASCYPQSFYDHANDRTDPSVRKDIKKDMCLAGLTQLSLCENFCSGMVTWLEQRAPLPSSLCKGPID